MFFFHLRLLAVCFTSHHLMTTPVAGAKDHVVSGCSRWIVDVDERIFFPPHMPLLAKIPRSSFVQSVSDSGFYAHVC